MLPTLCPLCSSSVHSVLYSPDAGQWTYTSNNRRSEAKVIVELKSVEALGPLHEAIILTYMRLSDHHLGLLINFNVSMLKDGIRRYIL
jgi:hypothetical protein